MTTRRVFFLTPEELTVYQFARGRLLESFAFLPTAEGLAGYARYLRERPVDPTLLLTDLIEEEFRTETAPHARGGARRELHARLAQRLFRTTPFRSARVLGRAREGRRDDRVLFSALTNPDSITPWLEPLRAARVPLLAISSVAHVSASIPRALGVGTAPMLLVSEEEGAGLRQSFFADGELRVSRLSPALAGDTPASSHATVVLEEIGRTERYLQRLQLLPFSERLAVHVLGSGERLAALRRATTGNADIHVWDLAEVARRTGCSAAAVPFANGLFARQFARAPVNRYAPPEQLHDRDLRRVRLGLEATGLAASVLLTLLIGLSGLQMLEDRRSTEALRAETARHDALTSGIPAVTAPSGLAPEQLRDVVESAERLSGLNMSPELSLQRLGKTLETFPEFEIHRLRWAAATSPDFADVHGEEPEGVRLTRPAELGSAGPGVYHGLIVEGEVQPFDGNYRRALERYDQLVASLRRLPQVAAVEPIQRPLDISRRIRSELGTRAGAPPRAPFGLRMVFTP